MQRWIPWSLVVVLCPVLALARPPFRANQLEQRGHAAAVQRWQQAAHEFEQEARQRMREAVESKQREDRAETEPLLQHLRAGEAELRREAIARLEAFVLRHPGADPAAGEALFRLALLYDEDDADLRRLAEDQFAREQVAFARGKRLDPPVPDKPERGRALAVLALLHKGGTPGPLPGPLAGLQPEATWAQGRLADSAMYLEALLELEIDDREGARTLLTTLTAAYPDSAHGADAWLRAGELYFDDAAWPEATAAYREALHRAEARGDAAHAALALYKLGWSAFQARDPAAAVRWFHRLLKQPAGALDLRAESRAYLGRALAEPDWDGDGCDDFGAEDARPACPQLPARMRAELYAAVLVPPSPTVREAVPAELQPALAVRDAVRQELADDPDVARSLADVLLDQATDDFSRTAVVVLRAAVARDPQARQAEVMQRKLVRALDILAAACPQAKAAAGHPDDARAQEDLAATVAAQEAQIAERQAYLERFGAGSAWRTRFGEDRGLVDEVDATRRRIARELAGLLHGRAQALRSLGHETEALAAYARAAEAYETLRQAEPDADDAPELAWQQAEARFFAGSRCAAATDANGQVLPLAAEDVATVKAACASMRASLPSYAAVRDGTSARVRRREAAWSMVLALGNLLRVGAALPPEDPQHLPAQAAPGVRPSAADLQPGPTVALAPDTQAWLEAVDGWLGLQPEASDAAKLSLQAAELLLRHRQGKDAEARLWTTARHFPATVQAHAALADLLDVRAQAGDRNGISNIARVLDREADLLTPQARKTLQTEAGRWLVDESLQALTPACATARWQDCRQQLDVVEADLLALQGRDPADPREDRPRWRHFQRTRAWLALTLTDARAARLALEQAALWADSPQDQRDDLGDAANLAESEEDWPEAARLRGKLVELHPDAEGLASLGKALQRQGEGQPSAREDERHVLQRLVTEFAGPAPLLAQKARGRLAELALLQGNRAEAEARWRDMVADFHARHLAADGGAEANLAAGAAFQLLQARYDAVLATQLHLRAELPAAQRARDLQEQARHLADAIFGTEKPPQHVRRGGLADAYAQDVQALGVRDWSYAAVLHRSRLLLFFARSLYRAPVPGELSQAERDAYQDQLETIARPVEDRAVKWLASAVQDADSKGVVNAWTEQLRLEYRGFVPGYQPPRPTITLPVREAPLPGVETELR